MNKARRLDVNLALVDLNLMIDRLDAILVAEQEAFDAIPASLQDSDTGKAAQDAIADLEDAISNVEAAVSALESATA